MCIVICLKTKAPDFGGLRSSGQTQASASLPRMPMQLFRSAELAAMVPARSSGRQAYYTSCIICDILYVIYLLTCCILYLV